MFLQRGYPAMVLRYITADMPRLEKLGLPDVVTELVMLSAGWSSWSAPPARASRPRSRR